MMSKSGKVDGTEETTDETMRTKRNVIDAGSITVPISSKSITNCIEQQKVPIELLKLLEGKVTAKARERYQFKEIVYC